MIRTRCPACQSIFRVTPEQLQLKAGKVRCGHCHGVFNALENIQSAASSATHLMDSPPVPQTPEALTPAAAAGFHAEQPAAVAPDSLNHGAGDASPEIQPLESARDAGLVAARELSETQSFNRWAAGTMATDGSSGFGTASRPRRTAWWVALALLLLLTLVGQVVYHFRSDIVVLEPRLAPAFSALQINVPRPAHGELVVIESTELHANSEGAGLLLGATLKNRAPYTQAWPMLELTLTDVNDKVLVRRVFSPAEYLSTERVEEGFLAHGEVAVKLLLDANGILATGYSLYAFYP